MPWRNVKKLPFDEACRTYIYRVGNGRRHSRSLARYVRIWTAYLPMQGVLFDLARSLSLAVLVLPDQATSPLKLMIDRLVCADAGNPDPTRTHGKDAGEAQKIELDEWDYPRHLAGRAFSVVVHGDAEGALELRRALSDWLTSWALSPPARPRRLIATLAIGSPMQRATMNSIATPRCKPRFNSLRECLPRK